MIRALIADDQIDSEHIVDGSIDLAHMSVNSIDSDQYVDGSIDTAHIAADNITSALIADDQIDSEHIVDGSVDNVHLANSSITVTDGSNSTATSLGGTVTFAGTANEVDVVESSGTITYGLPNNVTISGDLTVNGDTTTVNTSTLAVEDPLIALATGNNATDAVDIGLYGLYDTSGSQVARPALPPAHYTHSRHPRQCNRQEKEWVSRGVRQEPGQREQGTFQDLSHHLVCPSG